MRGIYGQQCYLFLDLGQTWYEAEEFCENKNAYLAELIDVNEMPCSTMLKVNTVMWSPHKKAYQINVELKTYYFLTQLFVEIQTKTCKTLQIPTIPTKASNEFLIICHSV